MGYHCPMETDAHMESYANFSLGEPALVCRWRLADGELPLARRHLRALASRRIGSEPVAPELVAWASQHIESTLREGSREHPDGVLMLVVDKNGRAAMTVGPYEPLLVATAAVLAARAEASLREAEATGVAPETLWAVEGKQLRWQPAEDARMAGATSLVSDLAKTIGMAKRKDELLIAGVLQGADGMDGVFLSSDEHGIVVASDCSCERAEKFAQGYDRLRSRRA